MLILGWGQACVLTYCERLLWDWCLACDLRFPTWGGRPLRQRGARLRRDVYSAPASLFQEAGHWQEPAVHRIGGEAKTLEGEHAE